MTTAPPEPPGLSAAPPLAGLPLQALRRHSGELARRWAIELIRERPLQRIGEVALGDVARDGAQLCAEVLDALASDEALADLVESPAPGAGGGPAAPRLLPLAGASDGAGAVAAVEALRGVLWSALAAQMVDWSARAVGDAADRLAHVCSRLAASVLAGVTAGVAPPAGGPAAVPEHPRPGALQGAQPPPAVVSRGGAATIVDEHMRAADPAASRIPLASDLARAREIEVRDQRRPVQGPAAWIEAIGQQLERRRDDGLPFAVLLVQATGWEPSGHHAVASSAAHRLEQELEALLGDVWSHVPERGGRPRASAGAGSLTRERAGRYWLVLPGVDGADAQLLAEQLTHDAPASLSSPRRAFEIAIGTASCPADGNEAAALAAHADVGLYAARAAARAGAGRR